MIHVRWAEPETHCCGHLEIYCAGFYGQNKCTSLQTTDIYLMLQLNIYLVSLFSVM